MFPESGKVECLTLWQDRWMSMWVRVLDEQYKTTTVCLLSVWRRMAPPWRLSAQPRRYYQGTIQLRVRASHSREEATLSSCGLENVFIHLAICAFCKYCGLVEGCDWSKKKRARLHFNPTTLMKINDEHQGGHIMPPHIINARRLYWIL